MRVILIASAADSLPATEAVKIQWNKSAPFVEFHVELPSFQGGQREVVVRSFTAYVEKDPETQLFVGTVTGVPGAHSQAVTLEELRENLREVLQLCLNDCDESLDWGPVVVGLQQIETAVLQ